MAFTVSSIGKKTVRNAAWLYGQKILTKIFGLVSIAILARQLPPSDFGIVSLAAVLMSFITLSTSASVGPYVINNRDEGFEKRDQSAFWLNMVFAIIVVSIYWCLIPYITEFYGVPLLKPILLVLSIKLIFAQLSIVPDSIVRRNLNYNQLVIRDTTLNFISVVLSIVMALNEFGVWSLILPDLLISIPRFFIILRMSKWKPKLTFETHTWKEIIKFSKYIVGSTLLGGLINDGDTMVLGRIIGTEQLGFYDRSWRTANLVSSNVVSVVGDISQPAFSALTKTHERLQNAYKKTVRNISLISFPLLIGMFVLADEMILTIYGPNWTSSILLLRIFIIFALQRAVFSTTGTIYNVMKRPDIGFKLNIVQLPFYFAAILIGNIYGIVGITIGVTLVRTIFGFITMYLSCKLIDISTLSTIKSFIPSLLISLLMGMILFVTKWLISPFVLTSPIVGLLIYSFGGIIIYTALLIIFFPKLLFEIINIIGNLSTKLATYLMRVFKKRLSSIQNSNFGHDT